MPKADVAPTKTPDLVAEIRRLYEAGWRIKHIALKTGVPRTNVYDWLGLEKAAAERIDDNARNVDEYHDELRVFAEQYRDIHVRLLGDPPLYRSALWRREDTEG